MYFNVDIFLVEIFIISVTYYQLEGLITNYIELCVSIWLWQNIATCW